MERLISCLEAEKPEDVDKALNKFILQNSEKFEFGELNQGSFRERLWRVLFARCLLEEACRLNCVITMRLLSRDNTNLNSVVSKDELDTLMTAAGKLEYSEEVRLECRKCIFNLIKNNEVIRSMSTAYMSRILADIESYQHASKLLYFDIRTFFFLTASCPDLREKVRLEYGGAIGILLDVIDKMVKETVQQAEAEVVMEALKSLFNLTLNDKVSENKRIAETVRRLCKYDQFTRYCIQLMSNMSGDSFDYLLGDDGSDMSVILCVLKLLEQQLQQDQEEVSVTVMALTLASTHNRSIRKFLRNYILPPRDDVMTRPEVGTSLRSRLCRLLTSSNTLIKETVAELLFILCKEKVSRMVKYTGYGNAAGLLARKGLMLGGRGDTLSYSSESEDSDTEEYQKHQHEMNPITGCYEAVKNNPLEGLSEEQKEVEAMRLVNVIDQLDRCGVIKPMRIGEDGKPHPIEHVLQLQKQ